jgi:hypothetical protein
VKWAEPIREELAAHLVRLGLEKCAVCDAGLLGIAEKPVLLLSGGAPWPTQARGGKRDPDSVVNYMVRVECNMCGYNLLFNSERFHDGDTPMFEPL